MNKFDESIIDWCFKTELSQKVVIIYRGRGIPILVSVECQNLLESCDIAMEKKFRN